MHGRADQRSCEGKSMMLAEIGLASAKPLSHILRRRFRGSVRLVSAAHGRFERRVNLLVVLM